MASDQRIQLVIWDLDNTLWSGSVYYRDRDAVALKPGTAAALKELSKRGIRCTICSKNNPEDALAALQRFEIVKYFEFPKISWERKSVAIRELATHFGVSDSNILFIDDDPFERAEVQASLPEIHITELTDPIDVLALPGVMPLAPTEEDLERVQILKQQRNREEAEKEHAGTYQTFLTDCDIKMTVRPIVEADWPRVVQLFNRTNELNATGNRYVLDELKRSYETEHFLVFVAELRDRFGDYGLIAESIVDAVGPNWSIRDLAVSCRTMGRGIGGALVTAILEYAQEVGVETIFGYLVENESNWRMKSLFEGRKFTFLKQEGNRTTYQIDLKSQTRPSYKPWLKVERRPRQLQP